MSYLLQVYGYNDSCYLYSTDYVQSTVLMLYIVA